MPNREQAAELFVQAIAKEVFEKTARTVFHRLEHGPTSKDCSDPSVQRRHMERGDFSRRAKRPRGR
jgi:hypothetical protein